MDLIRERWGLILAAIGLAILLYFWIVKGQFVSKMNRKDGATRLFLFRAIIMRQSRVDGGDASRILGTAVDISDFPAISKDLA